MSIKTSHLLLVTLPFRLGARHVLTLFARGGVDICCVESSLLRRSRDRSFLMKAVQVPKAPLWGDTRNCMRKSEI